MSYGRQGLGELHMTTSDQTVFCIQPDRIYEAAIVLLSALCKDPLTAYLFREEVSQDD